MSSPVPKPSIAAIKAYTPGCATTGDSRPSIKLSSNENPLGTSELARHAFGAAAVALHRYPDPGATALREAIANQHSLDPARIICGTGSDEILHLAAGAFAGPGDDIVHARHGFSVYPIAARRVGAVPIEATDVSYGADVDSMLAAVTSRTRVVFLANPNNPTGTFLGRAELARLHGKLPESCLLVLDQAYVEYVDPQDDDGGLALAKSTPNVLITRTFSKIYGLAAERIGWAYGAARVIAAMNKIRAPFNVTTCGQAAAIAALTDTAFVAASKSHNEKWRGWLARELASCADAELRVTPSRGNFLLVRFEGAVTAEAAFHGLMKQGYIVRAFPGQDLAHALRITIGSMEETRGVATALRNVLSTARGVQKEGERAL